MDLEEELSLFVQEETTPAELGQQSQTNDSGEKENDDLLGLDQTIKLSSRAKIAKIDNERIFNKQKGLSYVTRNHSKLIRVFQKNDKALQKKLLTKKSSSNSKAIRQLKHENEYDNLSSMLQFYQLWCHGLFPKAKFKDCLLLLRSFGSKSSQLKIYRRELIEQELRKLKESKGMIEPETMRTDNLEPQNPDHRQLTNEQMQEITQNADDDDWSFMNTNQSNGLFVGEEDDLYHTNLSGEAISKDPDTTSSNSGNNVSANVTNSNIATNNSDDSDNPFSDDNDDNIPTDFGAMNKRVEYPYEETDANDQEQYEDEIEIMREMGL